MLVTDIFVLKNAPSSIPRAAFRASFFGETDCRPLTLSTRRKRKGADCWAVES